MYFCPRCKAEVSHEALYCQRCGFNATNARLKSLSGASNGLRAPDRPGVPDTPQPGTHTLHVSPVHPRMPEPTRTIQPQVKRVMSPRTGTVSSTPPISPVPMASTSMSINAGLPAPARPPVIVPSAPLALPEAYTNPSIPSRPVPSSLFTRQSSQKQITPAHLLALQPSIPSTPPALPAQSMPVPPHTPRLQQAHQLPPVHGQRNASQPPPAQSVGHRQRQEGLQEQQGQMQGQIGQPQRSMSNTTGSAESFAATSTAAEHWRTSWRNRQRSEAGPATEVSRGHSSVPEPLMVMQYSLARIRAIAAGTRQKKKRVSVFWVSIALVACLIIGTSAFIVSTYAGNSGTSTTINTPPPIAPPTLSVKGSQGATISVGQILHVHGDNFKIGDPIIFLLDGSNSISGTNGREIATQVSNTGTFDVNLPVATSWTNGPHVIEAKDNQTGQTAYLSIQVGPATLTGAKTIHGLSLSQSQLNFQAYIGQGDPKEQFITLTNTSNATLTWRAKATTDDSLHWLAVDTTTINGAINAGGTANVGIEATTSTLKNTGLPFTGDILLSINGQTQLIVPVTLLVQKSAEWIFSPNPVIGVLSAQGGTCKSDDTLSLINLGNVPIFWHILLSSSATSYVQFMINGKPHMQGVLAPAGQNGDTQVLTLACNNVQIGATYPFTIDANNILWNDSVFIQAS